MNACGASAWLVACLAGLLLAGCDLGRHHLGTTTQDRVFKVESGDRIFFSSPENLAAGHRWSATCDDGDVTVSIEHRAGSRTGDLPDLAKVEIRIHRGYDGPSTVRFTSPAPAADGSAREFCVMLYRVTGDRAAWR